ncbi:MAG: hypothetical protein AAF441_10055 [Pseudomonadota bacterium]
MIGISAASLRLLAALALVAVAASGCLGAAKVSGPDPAAIEAAKARGGQAIDPTHVDAGELLAIESGVLDQTAPSTRAQVPYSKSSSDFPIEQAPAPVADPPPRQVSRAQPAAPKTRKRKPGKREIAAVAVPRVTGAPGSGNSELTQAMREVLSNAGWPVRNRPGNDTLTIAGTVEVGKAYRGRQPVQLAWTVSDPAGKVLGTIRQRNQVAPGSVDQGFGASARFVAKAASSGIFDLVKQAQR